MKYIFNSSADPYFNLAAEEYLLNSLDDEIFMLWRNRACVVIGKNQNAYAEIDVEYVRRNNIAVIRRNSGGGAVFHDPGNINFTFISVNSKNVDGNFRRFTQPIIAALQSLGITAKFSGRNDIVVNGFKVSGNAQYYRNNRVLHHGTLLYSGDLNALAAALKPNPLKLQSKGVTSIRSRVANLETFLKHPLTVEEFMRYLFQHCLGSDNTAQEYCLTKEDIENITRLAEKKYHSWEWNFGKNPQFNYFNEQRFSGGIIGLFLDVNNGLITSAKITGDFFGKRPVEELENFLLNTRFERQAICDRLKDADIDEYLAGITLAEFISLIP